MLVVLAVLLAAAVGGYLGALLAARPVRHETAPAPVRDAPPAEVLQGLAASLVRDLAEEAGLERVDLTQGESEQLMTSIAGAYAACESTWRLLLDLVPAAPPGAPFEARIREMLAQELLEQSTTTNLHEAN